MSHYTSDDKATPSKEFAVIQLVFEEGLSLKNELAGIKKLQPKKREELKQRAKRFHKLLKDNEKILAGMFGDVSDDEEVVSIVDSLLDELRQIYARLGVEVKMA
jgi:hypothetical protein